MRFIFTADKDVLEQLSSLQVGHKADGEVVSKAEVLLDAVQMLYQIDTLLSNGYKLAIIDPKGKKHYLRKGRKPNEGQNV